MEKITLECKNQIYYLGFGQNEPKSLNVIYEKTMQELDEALDKVHADKKAKGLVLFSHKPGCFFAGMDINVIKSLSSEAEAISGCEGGQAIFNKIEDLKIPTLAVVDGVCLGGGLEMVLACDQIIASDDKKTKIGLPEVMIGVLPGFGGTYRLPKRIGLTAAMDLILSGKQVRAKRAKKIGLIDAVMPKERLMEKAASYLGKKKVRKKSFHEKMMAIGESTFVTRKVIFQKAREQVMKKTKGFYPSPLKILDHLENSYGDSRQRYLSKEARAFAELSQTKQAKNIQHVFFLHDNSKKMDSTQSLINITKSSVLGAGVMGGGIAWLMAKNNQSPIMKDISKDGLELGLKQASENFKKALKRRRMSKDDYVRKQRSISAQLGYDGFQSVDLVVEAVVENMNVKKSVFKELETKVSKDCLLTTNTSSLSVNEMGSVLEDSTRFAGLHFFNPVHKMPLVEIIKHDNVSEKTIASLYKWCLDVGKTPVVVGDGPGFLVNRILGTFLNEACHMLDEGIALEQIEKAALNFGMPMGPARLIDEIGLDVCVHVAEILEQGLGERLNSCTLTKKIVETGQLGKKTGAGFYVYKEGEKESLNPKVTSLLSPKKSDYDELTIQMRLFLPMINEAAFILDEGIALDAGQVDLAMIFGTGFPPFKGGLLKFADNEGLDRILTAIKEFERDVCSKRFMPSAYLVKKVENNENFYKE